MRVKVPKCILTGTNECVEVESPARSDNQETLLYSHYHPHKHPKNPFPLHYLHNHFISPTIKHLNPLTMLRYYKMIHQLPLKNKNQNKKIQIRSKSHGSLSIKSSCWNLRLKIFMHAYHQILWTGIKYLKTCIAW